MMRHTAAGAVSSTPAQADAADDYVHEDEFPSGPVLQTPMQSNKTSPSWEPMLHITACRRDGRSSEWNALGRR